MCAFRNNTKKNTHCTQRRPFHLVCMYIFTHHWSRSNSWKLNAVFCVLCCLANRTENEEKNGKSSIHIKRKRCQFGICVLSAMAKNMLCENILIRSSTFHVVSLALVYTRIARLSLALVCSRHRPVSLLSFLRVAFVWCVFFFIFFLCFVKYLRISIYVMVMCVCCSPITLNLPTMLRTTETRTVNDDHKMHRLRFKCERKKNWKSRTKNCVSVWHQRNSEKETKYRRNMTINSCEYPETLNK